MSYSGKFKDKNNNLHPVTSVLYGTCDTAAATAAKVVTCSDFDTLMTGVTIRVKFANVNTAASPTVNINSTGAKSVYRFGSTAPVDGNSWNAGEVVELVYDGTSFFMTGADDIAAKQNATDNSLQTTDKTVVGAINEHEGDIGSLKSGLTTLDNEVNGDAITYPYADVITIEDAVPSNLADCSVKIEPVQDLHGYDKPWVGGAGKNKFNLDLITQTVSGVTIMVNGDGTFSTNGTASADININILGYADTVEGTTYKLNGCPSGGGDNTYKLVACDVGGGAWYSDTGYGVSNISYDRVKKVKLFIASGANVSGKTFKPMVYLNSETDATFAPYTNICPITGHTEASVQRTGANLAFDTISGKNINASGVIINADFDLKVARVTSGVTYTAYTDDSSSVYAFYSASPASGSASYNNSRTEATVSNSCFEFTAPIDGYIAYRTNVGYARTECVESSKNNQYTIALGDTIYGGTVDFDSGVMTVDMALVDLGQYDYSVTDIDNQYFTTISHRYKAPTSLSVKPDWICDSYDIGLPTYTNARPLSNYTIGCFGNFSQNNIVFVRDPRCSSAAEMKTALNGVQLCYELATPTTVQLTPQQIQVLKGTNTLTASTGQISVTVNGVSGSIGSVQEQVNELAEEVAEIKPLNYSTEEQKTGQKWIDGKDIYFRTWDFGEDISISNIEWTSLAIETSGFSTVTKSEGVNNSGGSVVVNVSISEQYVRVIAARDNSNFGMRYLTLYYTKTT